MYQAVRTNALPTLRTLTAAQGLNTQGPRGIHALVLAAAFGSDAVSYSSTRAPCERDDHGWHRASTWPFATCARSNSFSARCEGQCCVTRRKHPLIVAASTVGASGQSGSCLTMAPMRRQQTATA